jgi:hypothetical protein
LEGTGDDTGGWEVVKQKDNQLPDMNNETTVSFE